LDRIEENGIVGQFDIADNTMSIRYGDNTINAVGFRKSSGDQKSKLKSLASYNTVIIEEADEIPEEDFMQLDDSLRTVKGDIKIILLLNPPAKNHWIIQRWFDLVKTEIKGFYRPVLKPSMTNTIAILSDYHDNEVNLAPDTIRQYEEYKETKPSHYYNMIKGLVPEVLQGKIYDGWQIIDEVPFEARLERYGLDFGYTNDPTVIEAIYYYNGGYIIDEVCYQTGMKNKMIADLLLNLPKALVVADSAEPKSIDEIAGYGVSIVGSQKGQGSVMRGIDYVQSQKISVTRRSAKTLKAYDNYKFVIDKEGNVLNEPDDTIHEWSNAMDAIRYGIESLKPQDTYYERPKKNWTLA
jgi:phage terminase large subunit